MRDSRAAALTSDLHQRWIASCRSRWPAETCGIVIGGYEVDTATIVPTDFTMIRNAALDPLTSFAFDPDDWVRAWYDAERSNRTIVGVFHSHPDGSITPSAADTAGRMAWGSYWIVGLSDAESRIAVYMPESASKWRRLPLHIRTQA